jgi:hypothetical protein
MLRTLELGRVDIDPEVRDNKEDLPCSRWRL